VTAIVERKLADLEPGTVVEVDTAKWGRYIPTKYAVYASAQDYGGGVFEALVMYKRPNARYFEAFAVPIGDKNALFVLAPKTEAEKLRAEFNIASTGLAGTSITSGTDPEIFVVDADGEVIPAWDFLPAEKDSGKRLIAVAQWGHYTPPAFWDGVQAEMAPGARACLEQLHDNIQAGLYHILHAARAKHSKAKLSVLNTVRLSETLLQNAKTEHLQFRCSPSMNIYNESDGMLPDFRKFPYRFAGGHIHIGLYSLPAPITSEIIHALDSILAVAGVSMAADIDTPERRKMYGKCGEFRLPKHGIEYRVLSNFWLCHPAISHLTFELMRQTVKFAMGGLLPAWDVPLEQVREVVNGHDVKTARKILGDRTNILSRLFQGRWDGGTIKRAVTTICNGVDAGVKDPADIEDNWHLKEGDKTWRALGNFSGGSWRSQVAAGLCPARIAKAK